MINKYDNSERLDEVSEQDWREALDQLTAYLTWRLRGKTQSGAHSQEALGMPAFDYYQETAVTKLIQGDWKWQERFTLGKQLEKIAADLITKQTQKWLRSQPLVQQTDDIDQYQDIMDDDSSEELDETYSQVYALVQDDSELTIFVNAIEHCGNFQDLPEHLGWDIKKVYRMMEKLMRRIKRWKKSAR